MSQYVVMNTQMTDLEKVYEFFDRSIAYQEERGYQAWRNYDKGAIVRDIEEGNQYKVVIDEQTGIVFSVCYTDKIIWRERDKSDSVYLHRIVVNPDSKGQRLFGTILDWTIQHAREKGLLYVRMDTWADNPTIINYYLSFGFKFIENFKTPDSLQLAVHDRNLTLALLEYKI